MDIVFNCPNCEQELAVDQSGAGSQIECPACNQTITIPSAGKSLTGSLPPVAPPPPVAPAPAKKPELHLKVPVRDTPGEVLIDKPKPALEVVQKGAGKKLRVHTVRHSQCVESGHDRFDERVTEFLNQVTETNLVAIHTISYEQFDVGTQKVMTDYGVLIVYRG